MVEILSIYGPNLFSGAWRERFGAGTIHIPPKKGEPVGAT